MSKLSVSIIGGSGYAGGELARLLLHHPNVEVKQITSERYAGQFIKTVHPNLRPFLLKFDPLEKLEPADAVFLCLPHGVSMSHFENLQKKFPLIIDLGGDFRLNDPSDYEKWYGFTHSLPDLLSKKVLGIPELYSEEIKKAGLIACAGCMSTASILTVYPLVKAGVLQADSPLVMEAKTGSSGSGSSVNLAAQHAERSHTMRSFKPTGHRHTAEIIQELTINNKVPRIYFSATGVEAVRGILVTAQVILKDGITEKDIWTIYRDFVKDKPFLRIVKEMKGIYRYPEPKILIGTNMCEIGFEKETNSNRLVAMGAIDNLMKGAAGQAVQCLNVRMGWEETMGLATVGLHPI